MRIGCGCVNLGSASAGESRNDHVRLVRSAVEAGIDLFDTADVYGSGASERVLGRALVGRRSEVLISTKGGYRFRPRSRWEQQARRLTARAGRTAARAVSRPDGRDGAAPADPPARAVARTAYAAQDFSPPHLRQALEASLRRLRTDHVDVYQLHGPPEVHDDLFAVLNDLRDAGMVRRFGVGAESIASATAWADVSGTDVLQLPFGLLDPQPGGRLREMIGRPIEIWARGVLGGGVLSAAMRDPASVRDHPKSPTIEALLRLAGEVGSPIDELAVRWVLGRSDVDVTLLGMSSPDHLARNLALVRGGPLSDELADRITAAAATGAPEGSE